MNAGSILQRFGALFALALAFDWSASVTGAASAPPVVWSGQGSGFRSRELTVPAAGRTFLQRLPGATTGIAFTNILSEEKSLENSLRTSGAGVAAGDVDGDGWCDLYFCGMENDNALYRNLGGWRFEDITVTAGVACAGQYSTGAALADVDGDGDLDLLVNSLGGGTRLFFNDGRGRFTESRDSGLTRRFGATSMALADIDGDGDLDLYVCNYATTKIEDRPNSKFDAKTLDGKTVLTAIDGVPMTSPELTNRYYVDASKTVRELGEPDILYLNDGRGRFQTVSWTDGAFLDEAGKPLALPVYDFGLSVMFRDMDGDRIPDIYVCNDLFPPDRLWINDGRGRFRAMSNLAVRNTCRFAMGVDFADINRDGHDDFYVVDMLSRGHVNRKMQTVGVTPFFLPVGKIDNRPQYKRNTLFLNRGDGTYAEIAQYSGLEATEWSWMPAFLDVDLDGYEDVLVTTGHERDSLHADAVEIILRERSARRLTDAEHRALKKKHYPALRLSNQAFRNRGDLTFEDKAREWGFDYTGISHGLCLADLDNDGDQDVVVNHLNDGAGLHRNEVAAPRVAVRLRGRAPNSRGVGAQIRLRGGPVPQSQEIISGGRYLSSDDPMRTFAAGAMTNELMIEVTWRSGQRSTVRGVKANQVYEIDEAAAEAVTPHAPRPTPPIFQDASHLLNHAHVEDAFDDFERQPMLGRKLSQPGPGVSWIDLDGDGFEEVVIGSGRGGTLAILRNDGRGGFTRWEAPVLREPVARDLTTLLGWRKAAGRTVLLAGSSNYEDGLPQGSCVREFDLNQPATAENFPGWELSAGPMAMADLDGDGQLDLFVGGRVEPAKYPVPPASLMFRGTNGGFAVDEPNCRALGLAGLVNGAVFSDLDSDGDPDLVLACDWGPIKIFRNEGGRLTAWPWAIRPHSSLLTSHSSLHQLTGWWNGVTAGDFDGDGRLDLVAANWGRNTKYESHRAKPLLVLYGEWTAPGFGDVLEAYHDAELGRVVPWASYATAKALPWILERFQTQTDFSKVAAQELLGDRARASRALRAVWLETTMFLNRGDHFEVRVLSAEAQFAPAFGVCVGDMDGDGTEDIFLSQNFFAVDGDTSRYDAGRGLWLAGDGKGGFRPVPGQESGVKVHGEQRGAALCDYDADGRADLVVTQNGAETKLYHNTGARPGLRVRLQGPPGNPHGIGAVIRLATGDKPGPARELHAGSGYWSVDAATQVLHVGGAPSQLFVRWPGGKTTTTGLSANAREVVVDATGKLVVGPK